MKVGKLIKRSFILLACSVGLLIVALLSLLVLLYMLFPTLPYGVPISDEIIIDFFEENRVNLQTLINNDYQFELAWQEARSGENFKRSHPPAIEKLLKSKKNYPITTINSHRGRITINFGRPTEWKALFHRKSLFYYADHSTDWAELIPDDYDTNTFVLDKGIEYLDRSGVGSITLLRPLGDGWYIEHHIGFDWP